ncbi:MAG TPA: Cas8a1 family CRISPR/Cas system-associated protein [Chitinivibrionales bacterium]|nr:Cas8a1 family CRISPR/Cas system-associated protein [Chitinivibrionales bacterium]
MNIWKCDVCGHEADGKASTFKCFKGPKLELSQSNYELYPYFPPGARKIDLCEACTLQLRGTLNEMKRKNMGIEMRIQSSK